MTDVAHALWYVSAQRAEIRPTALPPFHEGVIEIETEGSLLSRGTERLVFDGRVPPGEHARMRAPLQEGDFPFPVKYGYAAVGRVTAGPSDLVGRRVFALAPHQDRHRIPAAMAVPVPDGVPVGRAVLAANMETALNASWERAIPPGSRVLVVGLGLVGLLVTAVLAARGDLSLSATDLIAERADAVAPFGALFRHPHEIAPGSVDLVFHTSASAAGLATALEALAFEGTVVELSWYGEGTVAVPLGGAFHANRLQILSSQVGHVAPTRRGRIGHRDRLAAALAHLADPRLDVCVTGSLPFAEAPAALPALLAPGAPGIATRLDYG
ncbi:MAG: zinc-binding alcohol dehydrogenase [Pseudomonadota bacterium]